MTGRILVRKTLIDTGILILYVGTFGVIACFCMMCARMYVARIDRMGRSMVLYDTKPACVAGIVNCNGIA